MTLDANVPFPLSIVLNRKALTKYQLLFRHLFAYHGILRLLGKIWTLHQTAFKRRRESTLLSESALLRGEMMDFVRKGAFARMDRH
jgi:gamma-tubulin complex component 2